MKNLILFLILLLSFSCDKKSEKNLKKIPKENKIDYFIFGRYCGESFSDSEEMYQYNVDNNEVKANFKSVYWETNQGKSKMNFPQKIDNDSAKIVAKQILNQIPQVLFESKTNTKFGCPDCSDGCGIFFEISQNSKIKKFYIDYQSEMIKQTDIRNFSKFLHKQIEQIDKIKK